MLQILRNKAQSVVIQAMVVVIALVFIFWGVGTNMMNSREAAIVVNDTEISFEDFQRAYTRYYEMVKAQLGDNIPQSFLENMGLKDQVANQLIQESLLRDGAEKMGLTISPAEIQKVIESMVEFQENGVFDMEKYESLLSVSGYSPHKYEDTIRYETLPQRASMDIQNFITAASDFEINDLNNLEKTTVAVDYVKITPETFKTTISPTDEELATWFDTVKDNYKTLPQVRLKYITYKYDSVAAKTTIEEENVQEYYEKNISKYSTPEMRRARHILLKVDGTATEAITEDQRKKAEDILKQAKAGEDFSELAKKYSEGPSKNVGGDLGLFTQGKMTEAFDKKVFSMEVGAISELVKTEFGYHIIKLEEIQEGSKKTLEDVHDEIVKTLQSDGAKKLADKLSDTAYKAIINAGSLKAYAEKNSSDDLKVTGYFNKTAPPDAFKNDPQLLDKIFSLKKGELSSRLKTPQGYTILFAEDIKPPTVPPLEDVKEKVEKDYTTKKAQELAKKSADELLVKAREVGKLTEAVTEGQKVEDSGFLAKNSASQNSSFPAALIEQIFRLTPGTPFNDETVEINNQFYVFQFKDRKTPDTILTDNEITSYRDALLNVKQQKLLSAWLMQQESKAKIMTNKNL